MESGLLLDVVVREGSAILELLSSEDKSLLVWWDTLLVLDLGLNVLDGVSWLDIKGDGLASEGLDEDLHTTSESQDEMESGLLLDVVVRKSSSILELLSGKDESLLIWWDTFLVLDFSLNVLNSISWLNIEGNGFSSESLDKDLHTSSKSEDQVESRLLLDIVIGEGSAVFQLLSSEDKSLLIWWDTFLVLDFSLDILNGVSWLDVQSYSLSCKGLDENLHVVCLFFKLNSH